MVVVRDMLFVSAAADARTSAGARIIHIILHSASSYKVVLRQPGRRRASKAFGIAAF